MAAEGARQLGAVVVGSGFGCFTHVRALRGAGFEVRALVGRDPAKTAEDGFAVHFRMRSGVVGTLQSTSGNWGPPLIVTRVTGSQGSVWIEGVGHKVWIADRNGTRRVPVPDELRPVPPDPPPSDALHSAYQRMVAHGLDLAPYTRLCQAFRDRILGRSLAPDVRPATFADGVAGMCVLDAIRGSAAMGGAWTSIS